MRNFTRQLIIKLRKFKIRDYLEVGCAKISNIRW